MANTRTLHVRLAIALVLAAMGLACRPTAMPLPMLGAGYGPAHASANGATTPGGEGAATLASTR